MLNWALLKHDASAKRFAILTALLFVCAFTGGSYRPDMPHLLLLRPVSIIAIAMLVAVRGGWHWQPIRALVWMLAIFAFTMIVQLVPIPGGWWAQLPGRGQFMLPQDVLDGAWRPISLAPDLTMNALFALLPALAVLIGFAGMEPRHRLALGWLVLAVALLSAVFAMFQILGGGKSIAYLYGQGDRALPTGLLANRNHQALLLTMVLPLIAALYRHELQAPLMTVMLAGCAIIVLPMTLLTGSRAGLALLLLGVIAALVMILPQNWWSRVNRQSMMIAGAGLTAVAALLVAVVLRGRALSLDRLLDGDTVEADMRWQALPTMMAMLRDNFPIGIGHGAFDPVFRSYEPDNLLLTTYFNRAHNDALELAMSGGLPAVLVLIFFLGWVGFRIWCIIAARSGRGDASFSWAGAIIITMALLGSLLDYPLRPNLISMVFAMACCWLAVDPVSRKRSRGHERSRRAGANQ